MTDLVTRLRECLLNPVSHDNITKVIEHNKEVGLIETGGEFSLEGALAFFDIPNESIKILHEVMQGNYANIERLRSIANGLRDLYRTDFCDKDDNIGLGDLIAVLVLLREGKTLEELGIKPDLFFVKYIKVFSPIYIEPERFTLPNSCGVYHTHPFGIFKKPEGRDLTSKFPSLILEFDLQNFNGSVSLHFIDIHHQTYSFIIDTNKKQYEEVKQT